MRTLRLFAFAVLLASCGVEATSPLTPASSARLDSALLGTWRPTEKDKSVFVVTARPRSAVVRVEITGDKDPMQFEGHVSELAPDLKVLNLQALDEHGKAKGSYLFVRYALNADGSLELWLVDDKLASAALNAGTLKGRRGQYGGVTLEDTPEKMIAFITKGSRDEMFERLVTLKKR